MKKQQKKMDNRCPRKLEDFPDSWCPLAVQRLKALRHADRELTEEEESKLGGCPWGVNHQMANYCFFKMIAEHMPESRNFSSIEIAHFNNISQETVNKVEKTALSKIRESEMFKEIDDLHGSEGIMTDLDGMG